MQRKHLLEVVNKHSWRASAMSYSGLLDSLVSFVLMCCIELVIHFVGKMVQMLAWNYIATTNTTNYIATSNTTQSELIPSDYKHWIISRKI
jgi:hypothetical protein